MSWASCIALPPRRRKTARRHERAVPLRLDHAQCAAGDTVVGTVAGGARVAILRVERRPHNIRVLKIAEAPATPPTGAFRLSVPDDALPSTAGERCTCSYLVRARTADAARCMDLVVMATASPHLVSGSWPPDRLLANWDARHFHIELLDAELHGGGRLSGRVHRHATWTAEPIVVTARCLECWTASAPAYRGVPQWHTAPLWEDARPVRVDPDATWAPFGFELPDRLPTAVEASTIAWRYELIARRHVRHWFDETAALTPLLFAPAWPGDILGLSGPDG